MHFRVCWKNCIGHWDLRLHHWMTTLRRFDRLLGNTPMSNVRFLLLQRYHQDEEGRNDTLRLPSVRFNLTEHLARNSVGVSSGSRVRTIASKTVRKDLKAARVGRRWKREKARAWKGQKFDAHELFSGYDDVRSSK